MTKKFFKAIGSLDIAKTDKPVQIPGILGFTLNGVNTVEVPTRPGFVFVRLRNNTSEVIQAYNDKVAPVYNLPVIVGRDTVDKSKYRIIDRDIGIYGSWGSGGSYLPKHGHTHSFIPEESGGGDVVWVYGRQMMPLAVYPSGTSGSENVIIKPSSYYAGGIWHYAGGTGTASLFPYKPTDNTARMILIYLDEYGNPGIEAGSTYFTASITGNAAIVPYLPPIVSPTYIPLAGIRLVSGTSALVWDNIYDLRPWIVGDGFIYTGAFASIVHTEKILVYDDSAFKTSGTAISFDDRLEVSVTGTVVFVDALDYGVIGFFYGGSLAVGTIPVRNLAPRNGVIENVTASVHGSPVGSSIIVNIDKNSTSIYTVEEDKPTILAGEYKDLVSAPTTTSFSINDEFTAEIEQIGSSSPGTDLEIQIRYRYA